MKENLNKKKRCPRCGTKLFLEVEKCPECGLLFSRIQNLSNERAKEEIKKKRMSNVIEVSTMPSDVSKKKFWLLFLLTGWFGGHNLYIGKFKRGYYSLITGILAVLAFLIYEIVFFQGGNANLVYYYFTGPCMLFFVFAVMIWFIDLVSLTFKSFKYPATLSAEDLERVITKKVRGR